MTIQELYQSMEGDYAAALKTMMNESIIGRLMPRYLNDPSCQKMLDAGAVMDAKGLFEGAHALKGVAGNLGMLKLSRMASELCEEFRPGKERQLSDAEVQAKLADIGALQEKTLAAIRAFVG